MLMSKKVLLIGLDGATWDLIKPWVEEGKLPVFRKLMEKGVWGYLESAIPPNTSPGWECISTGKNPATLNIGPFITKLRKGFIATYEFLREVPKIWDYLSFKGFRVIAANVPCLIEPYKINGYLIVGSFYKYRSKITYPENLEKEIKKIIKEYKFDVMIKGREDEKIFEDTQELFKSHFKIFEYLLTTKEWDFAFITFTTPDRAQHPLWHRKDLIFLHFKLIDEKISELLEKLPSVNVFFVSDHGFGKRKFAFNINDWLIKEGYLKTSRMHSIISFLKKRFIIKTLKSIVNALPLKLRLKAMKFSSGVAFKNEIDWKKTKAFSYSPGCGEIYINLKEKYEEGCVSLSEYENLRNEIIQKLKKLKNPITGEKINVEVYKKEDIYSNSYLTDNIPDIIVIQSDDGIHGFISSIKNSKNVFTIHDKEMGDHRLFGFFLAYGPDIKNTGEEIKNLKIYDIAPTILHMFGLPIPKDMDGRVLTEIFKEDSEIVKRKPVFVEPSYYEEKIKKMRSISEKERIRERIRKIKEERKV